MIAGIKAQACVGATTGEYRYHVCHPIHHPKALPDAYIAYFCLVARRM
jgi:hypothetical protein